MHGFKIQILTPVLLYTAALIRKSRRKNLEAVARATMDRLHEFNHRRRMALSGISHDLGEANCYRQESALPEAARLKPSGLRNSGRFVLLKTVKED